MTPNRCNPEIEVVPLPPEITAYLSVLSLLPDDERAGQLAALARHTKRLDPRGRPADEEPQGGAAVVFGILPPHPAYGDPRLSDPEMLAYLGRRLLARLQREGRIDELRLVVGMIDSAFLVRLLDDDEREVRESNERDAQVIPAVLAAKAEAERAEAAKAERMAQIAQLWAGWLEEQRETIEAYLATPAPVDLSQGETLWLVLDSHARSWGGQSVIGASESLEEAQRAALKESMWLCTPERLAECYEHGPEGETLAEVIGTAAPGGYLRLSGDPVLIRSLLRGMRSGGVCGGGVLDALLGAEGAAR